MIFWDWYYTIIIWDFSGKSIAGKTEKLFENVEAKRTELVAAKEGLIFY